MNWRRVGIVVALAILRCHFYQTFDL